jgi:hypothetical protein
MQYIQSLFQSRLSTADHALSLVAPAYSLGLDYIEDTNSDSSSLFSCFFYNNSSNVELASVAEDMCLNAVT